MMVEAIIKMKLFVVLVIACLAAENAAQKDPHFAEGRHTIVHLFEWKWDDIANECENFLGPKGYAGVQISPPNENLVIAKRPWWERYQPVSYILKTRSGGEHQLASMIQRCNKVGIRIYADLLLNDMAANDGVGTAGSHCDATNKSFPAVPYLPEDFHPTCLVNNYKDPKNVRNCELLGLKDLDQSQDWVREKMIEYMDHLIDLGVAGFRVDAAKHMWPADLEYLYSSTKNLSIDQGFPDGARPFIYQEVIDLGGEAISKHEYEGIGRVLEFKHSDELGNAFQGHNALKWLVNWGPKWSLLESDDAVAFIDNHDNQRHGSSRILTYKNPKPYRMAIAFMLAHPYGTTRIMSSFAFDDADAGPPNVNGTILSPIFNADGTCGNGWVCEHRWHQIVNMVGFRNTAGSAPLNNWWTDNNQQIAFGRGDKAFIAFTLQGDLNTSLQTSLPSGTYCDIISGDKVNGTCTGKIVKVDESQKAQISLSIADNDGMVAIHVNAKL